MLGQLPVFEFSRKHVPETLMNLEATIIMRLPDELNTFIYFQKI